jgi:hypothetical protein
MMVVGEKSQNGAEEGTSSGHLKELADLFRSYSRNDDEEEASISPVILLDASRSVFVWGVVVWVCGKGGWRLKFVGK